MLTENRLTPNFRKQSKYVITGDRTQHLVTFNPSSANPGKHRLSCTRQFTSCV